MLKKISIPPTLLLLAFMLLGAGLTYAQSDCNAKQHEPTTIHRLPSNFEFQESFEITTKDIQKDGTVVVEYILKKGNLYVMDISNFRGEEKNVILEVYDQNNQLHATNYNPDDDVYFPVGYACHETGVHRFVFRFKDTNTECGIAVLMQR